ncbi:MAG: FAD-dependent oxidoreductase [Desulfobacteraceae bacterium]|nr:FAD-dependent oxidoreductase [Desulfobacteraceae bacterium]
MEILESKYSEEKKGLLHNIEEFPISRKDTSENQTGTWRTLQPLFEEAIAPCSQACPANVNIPEYMALVREGNLIEALELIRLRNPLPGVCGRVCPHSCEGSCNRGEFDQRVNIRAVERLLGDYGLDIPPTGEDERGKGRKVAIVGSGPAGLSAAYFLARRGVTVDLYEREPEAGGLLRYGIPEYRLPKEILDREIGNIFHLGVNFMGEREIRHKDLPAFTESYDYVFFSPGLWGSKLPDWGYKGRGVFDGLKVLREIQAGNLPDLGRRIVVVGGGNTALDVTRVLMRLNKEVVIVYRRTLQEAPAFEDEIEEGLEEQIRIMERSLITRIEEGEQGGLKIEIQGIAREDGDIVPGGPKDHMVVDSVIAAVGQMAEINVEGDDKIILGGDFETGAGTVAQAIGSGRKGAFTILERFGLLPACGEANSRRVVNYVDMNPAFFKRSERFEFRRREPDERTADFNEVVQGASPEEALGESNRCLCCGTCTLCGACWYFCPDACVIASKNGDQKVVFDLDFCKGCAICSVSCPRGCVVMEEEQ